MVTRSSATISVMMLIGVFSGVGELALGQSQQSVDLTSIDRTIVKEPVYQSDEPAYGLVVFGEQATSRLWLVTDGDHLYVDRNGNRDLTDDGERYLASVHAAGSARWHVGEIEMAGKRYVDFSVSRLNDGRFRVHCNDSRRRYKIRAGMNQRLAFHDSPDGAPILHFDGPLTILRPRTPFLVRGKEQNFTVRAGTTGLGEGTFTYVNGPEFGKSATIRFPASEGVALGPEVTFQFDSW